MTRAVVPCPVGCRGADLSTRLDAEQTQGLAAAGFQFLTRYLSLGAPNAGDLSTAEAKAVLDAGLGLMAVQHVRFPGWSPGGVLGAQDGAAAARHAGACGLPRGMTLWLDLEGTAPTSTAGDVSAHVTAWAGAVSAFGFEAGAYIGGDLPGNLDGEALWRLAVRRYWRSQSAVPNISTRGYQVLQLFPQCTVRQVFPSAPAGVRDIMIDVDIAQHDYRGDAPTMLVETPSA